MNQRSEAARLLGQSNSKKKALSSRENWKKAVLKIKENAKKRKELRERVENEKLSEGFSG